MRAGRHVEGEGSVIGDRLTQGVVHPDSVTVRVERDARGADGDAKWVCRHQERCHRLGTWGTVARACYEQRRRHRDQHPSTGCAYHETPPHRDSPLQFAMLGPRGSEGAAPQVVALGPRAAACSVASRAASGRPTPWHPPCSTCTTMSVEIFPTCPQSCDGDAATFARRVAQGAHWSEATLELVAQ